MILAGCPLKKYNNTRWFKSPSLVSGVDRTETMTDIAETLISMDRVSLQVCIRNSRHGVVVVVAASENMEFTGAHKASCVLQFAKYESIVTVQRRIYWTPEGMYETWRHTLSIDISVSAVSVLSTSEIRKDFRITVYIGLLYAFSDSWYS